VITKLFSARIFTFVFGIGYAISVFENHPLFRYYPLVKRWSMQDLKDPSSGPAMSYYGWIAMAAIPAVLAAALVPNRIGDRLPAAIYWILPFVMLLVGVYNERTWFL
jgi:hypothetical protein